MSLLTIHLPADGKLLPTYLLVLVDLGVLISGIAIGMAIFMNTYHSDLCQERFAHAETSADSLVIIQDDKFCLGMIEK